MIFTFEQRKAINDTILMIKAHCNDIEWITEDECLQYKNSIYASMIIGLGSGKVTKHLEDENMYNEIELAHYYGEQCKYFVIVHKNNDKIKIRVYKSNGNGLNGATLISMKGV